MRAPHKNLIAILFWSASFYLGKIVGSIFAFQNNVENFCVVANRSLRFTGGCGLGLHPLLFYGGIAMKKLKTWQKVLLIIFYPVGIVYFIVWLCKRNKGATPAPVGNSASKVIKEMYSNVVGTVYPNSDGSIRQSYIVKLKVGDDLFFHPAPTDEYPDSIGVFTKDNKQIGVLSYQTLNELRGLYLENNASVSVSEILHSERGLGVSMLIKIYEK